MVIFQCSPRNHRRDGLVIERPARGLKTKKPSDPDKTENEGIHGSRPALTEQAGLILLFDGEVDSAWAESRRAQPNRYPDFGLKTSLPPSRPGGPVALGVCNPLQWRNRPRFTRGSLTFGCDNKMDIQAHRFQRTLIVKPLLEWCQVIFLTNVINASRNTSIYRLLDPLCPRSSRSFKFVSR
jgi:hypothetical protein